MAIENRLIKLNALIWQEKHIRVDLEQWKNKHPEEMRLWSKLSDEYIDSEDPQISAELSEKLGSCEYELERRNLDDMNCKILNHKMEISRFLSLLGGSMKNLFQ